MYCGLLISSVVYRSGLPSLLMNVDDIADYSVALKQEISDYLSSIRSSSGLLSDTEYYFEKTLTLLDKPSLSLKRLKSLALQIEGQFTVQPQAMDSLENSFLCDYIKFRQNPPWKVIDLCREILQLSDSNEGAKKKIKVG